MLSSPGMVEFSRNYVHTKLLDRGDSSGSRLAKRRGWSSVFNILICRNLRRKRLPLYRLHWQWTSGFCWLGKHLVLQASANSSKERAAGHQVNKPPKNGAFL